MRFALATVVASAAALVGATHYPRQAGFCPEATRFGGVGATTTAFTAGNVLSVKANFTCAINNYNHFPTYIDYYLQIFLNTTLVEDIVLAHGRTIPCGSVTDQFTIPIPDAPYPAGSNHGLLMEIVYGTNGTNGTTYYTLGGVEGNINIVA